MIFKSITFVKTNGVGIIRMNNPKSMNALEDQLARELKQVTEKCNNDDEIGAVVLTGADKAFCAGGDLKRLSEGFTTIEGYQYMKDFHDWVRAFMNLEKPTIASVNGYAVGAGFCIAMLCDVIIASEKAKFGQAFVNVGLIPDLAGLYTLPRLVGLQKAKELVFTGDVIGAEEAEKLGIVNKVVKADELDDEAYLLAKKFADGPRVAMKLAKKVMNESINLSLDQLLELESQAQAQCFQTIDHAEAVDAFFKKRKPIFQGK